MGLLDSLHMTITRITFVRHAATSATRRAAFPLDESIDEKGTRAAQQLARQLGHVDAAWSGPAMCARETARALGIAPTIADELDEWDFGAWRGRTMASIQEADPTSVAAWMQDADAAPHGGESLVHLISRVGRWLDARSEDGRRAVAITHSAVIRAALVYALLAPPAGLWRLDVAPLSRTVLHSDGGRWTVRAVNVAPADLSAADAS